MPAGRSRAKSYIQLRLSAQRAVPCSGQSMSKGSTSRGSPNGTIASLKRAVTCRTPLTVPCGEKASIRGVHGGRGQRQQGKQASFEGMARHDGTSVSFKGGEAAHGTPCTRRVEWIVRIAPAP